MCRACMGWMAPTVSRPPAIGTTANRMSPGSHDRLPALGVDPATNGTTGAPVQLTLADWQYRFIARRGW